MKLFKFYFTTLIKNKNKKKTHFFLSEKIFSSLNQFFFPWFSDCYKPLKKGRENKFYSSGTGARFSGASHIGARRSISCSNVQAYTEAITAGR